MNWLKSEHEKRKLDSKLEFGMFSDVNCENINLKNLFRSPLEKNIFDSNCEWI